MKNKLEEIFTYQEVYEQLAALKHLIYSCIDLVDDMDTLAVLFSQQIMRLDGATPNAFWLFKEDPKVVEVALNGLEVNPGQRRNLAIGQFDFLTRMMKDPVVVWSSDFSPSPGLFDFCHSPVFYPIKRGMEVFGFFVVDVVQPRKSDLFQSIANFAGLIFATCRLHQEVKKQGEELLEMTDILMTQNAQIVSLHRASMSFAKALDQDHLLQLVTEFLVAEFGAKRAAAFHLCPHTQAIIGIAGSNGFQEIIGLQLTFGQEHSIWQASASGRTLSQIDRPGSLVLGPYHLSEWMIFPVKGRNEVLAVLIAEIDNEDNRDSMTIMVNNAGMMLDNLSMLAMQRQLSITDSLTGLHNHRFFMEQFKLEFSRAQRYCHSLTLLIADLDHFKGVNDLYGHLVGDLVLKEVAQRMKGMLRNSDVIARYGGEEIVVLLPELDISHAVTVADKLRLAICNDPIESEAVSFFVSISLGVAIYPCKNIHSGEDLFKKADQALYHAKATGRNKVVVANNDA